MSKMPAVVIGMPVGSGSVPWETAISLINTMRALDREGIKVEVLAPVGSSVVSWARSNLAERFLTDEKYKEFTHLFWIDSDMVWTVNDFVEILKLGAPLDVVGATYTFKKDDPQFCLNPVEDEQGAYSMNGLGCLEMKSMAIGFTLVKRKVMEKVAASKPMMQDTINGNSYRDIFRIGRGADGNPLGEDIAFFDDVRAAGFKVWLQPRVRLGHVGTKVFRGDPIPALGLEEHMKEIQA